jgi:type II secretory pathway predicted ATPase ExeA
MTHSTKTDDQERIAHILSERWIGYPKAMEVLQNMEYLLAHPKTYRMPSMLLVARSGNGKSVLLHRFFDAHKPVITAATTHVKIPVLYIQAPPIPNEKSFYSNILTALNAPFHSHSTASQMHYQVIRILEKVDTRILIIDEIHHILAGSYLSQRAFLNLIKYISNELQLVIIGAGIREAYSAINTDTQLASRFEPSALPTWKLDADYFRLLKSFEAMMPLNKTSKLTNEELAIKILSISGGTIGEISNILKKAAVKAVQTGYERIDLNLINNMGYLSQASKQKQYEDMPV